MARPRLLVLFCGAGGCSMGYHRAGFDVVGVDIRPQPNYPFEFHQGDAMTWPLDGFDAIHASPPCQDHMRTPTHNQAEHGTGWLLTATRDRLARSGIPWVIENVPGAPVRADYKLCGCIFGLKVRRERWFETSWHAFDLIPACDHSGEVMNTFRTMHGPWFRKHGRVPTRREVAIAMGIDWMSGSEHSQAIPPAYTEYIGRELLGVLAVTPCPPAPAPPPVGRPVLLRARPARVHQAQRTRLRAVPQALAGRARGWTVKRRYDWAAAAFTFYVAAIAGSNWLITHVGIPAGPGVHLTPVGFGLLAPSGVWAAAVSFPARDVTQRLGGRWLGIAAILAGAAASWVTSNPHIAVASGLTYLCSETADFAVYTPLQKRWFTPAVIASGCVAAVVDSVLFLHLAGLPAEARARGKHVHMGRVNSLKRLRIAASMGCHSADGTFLAFGPDKNLPQLLRWLRDCHVQQEALW